MLQGREPVYQSGHACLDILVCFIADIVFVWITPEPSHTVIY